MGAFKKIPALYDLNGEIAVARVEDRKLKFIGRQTDHVRNSIIDFYIEPAPGPRKRSGVRHLVARYEKGRPKDLSTVDGKQEFAISIPGHLTEGEVLKMVEGNFGSLSPTK